MKIRNLSLSNRTVVVSPEVSESGKLSFDENGLADVFEIEHSRLINLAGYENPTSEDEVEEIPEKSETDDEEVIDDEQNAGIEEV